MAGGIFLGIAAAPAFQAPSQPPLANVDKREANAAQSPAQAKAAAELRTRVSKANVDFDPLIASPRFVSTTDGFLTGPNGEGKAIPQAAVNAVRRDDPHRATKLFLHANNQLFGHGPEVLANARVKRDFTNAASGLKTVVWEQQVDGIPVFEATLIAHTTRRGELVNLSSHFVPNPVEAANRGTERRAVAMANPAISAARALALAAANLGEEAAVEVVTDNGAAVSGAEKQQKLNAPFLRGEAEARLIWVPLNRGALRLCWDVMLSPKGRPEMYRVLVDARTGDILIRRSLTNYLTNATYRVFTSDSPSPFSPGHPTPLTNQPALVARDLVTLPALDTNASPNGWIDDLVNETRGNNVDAHTDTNADNSPDLPRPSGTPFRVFDFPMDLAVQDPSSYRSASVAQLFYVCNWVHDRLYQLGFTEAAGNFQNNNFGRGGAAGDALQADAQDGSGTDNANMSTPPDGSPPRMQMYNFTGPSPRRDGDFDIEIVIHEYVHGLSNRRVGGGVGISALQSQGMGEGWSDWYGLTLLSESGDNVNGNYAAGGYATLLFGPGYWQNYYFGIRRYPYSTDLTKNPLTFRDIDPGQASSHPGIPHSPVIGDQAAEVHNQGEVWCVTLWEARANLIAKHGFATGNQLILQLVTDGMNLSPANPNFLQARDGIIQADFVATGGANRNELWAAFAKRGMGASASSPASSTTSGVVESFDLPDDLSIHPQRGFVASGPVGGPFTPGSMGFILTNAGAAALSWTMANTSSWLTATPTGGTLVPGGPSITVTAWVNAVAASLPMGIYSSTLRFTNLTSGVGAGREFMLRVGQPDYFTERFEGDNDLAFSTILFTPNGSADFYAACRQVATNFPTDPAGGTFFSLSDDSYAQVTVAGTNSVAIYNRRTNVFYIGSNGYLTLDAGDSEYDESFDRHFQRPRISALFDDLNPAEGGTISWKQLSNRVAVTFQNLPEYESYGANSFQFELFFDGRIRVTWLSLTARDGLAGLSRGDGVPFGFVESDLSLLGPCVTPLIVTVPSTASEGDGLLVGQGRVRLPAPLATNLTVQLSSSDLTEATVPASVIVPAGQTNALFDLMIVDDGELDGTQSATISAAAPGYANGTAVISVHDSETAALYVTLPTTVTEGAGSTQGVVSVSSAPDTSVKVNLVSSDVSEIEATWVIIPAGQTSAVFSITVLDDSLIDGPQTVEVVARVQNWVQGTGTVSVLDNENLNLTVLLPAMALENAGVLPNSGAVQLSGTLSTNLIVSLESSDLTEAVVPATATIVAGQVSAPFSITMVDDMLVDGTQTNRVTASAAGFVNGSATMLVLDDESPPIPSNPIPPDFAVDVAAGVDLAWTTGAAGITNEVYFGTTPTPGISELLGSTVTSAWSLPLLAPNTTYYWQIVARKIGVTAGPVWRFTTRGLDHVDFSPIASPQVVNQPFPVTLTARDELNRTVSNFTGTVRLAGFSGVLNPLSFSDDFEDGDISDWTNDGGSYIRMVTNSTAAGGLRSLTLIGGTSGSHYNGISKTFTNIQPAQIQFHVRAASTVASGYFVIGRGGDVGQTAVFFYMSSDSTMGIYDGSIWHGAPYVVGQWYRITFDINWPMQQLDYYVDGNLVASNIPFRANVNSLSTLHLYNFDYAQAWWDEIQFRSADEPLPIAITPTNTANFVGGIWNGNVTVLEPSTNMYLAAIDSRGHRDTSTNFEVRVSNDIRVRIFDEPDPVAVGGYLTNIITVDNSGPDGALGIVVTNYLPPTVSLLSAVPSQGSCLLVSNRVECGLDSLAPGRSATIVVVTVPASEGLITNRVVAGRIGTDGYDGNNSAESVTAIQVPMLTIFGANVLEGSNGLAAVTFPVRLFPPSPTNVSVNFQTFDGTAVAVADYLSTNGSLSFPAGATNLNVTVFVVGDTNPEPQETFSVRLSDAVHASLAVTQAIGVILNDDAPPDVYLRSITGSPWGSSANETAMDRVFGPTNWQDLRFETVIPAALFSAATRFIFMEGSDGGANELGAFLAANDVAIEAWVNGGGRLFINAAPNEGANMNFGFGVTLLYPDSTDAARSFDPVHPILLSPFTPVGNAWSGSSFGHATVDGDGLAPILVNSSTARTVLGERQYGNGMVLFGGMTTDNHHYPQPEASNLRANIIAYTARFRPCTNCPPTILVHPGNRTGLVGGSIAFSVTANGTAPLAYQWRKEGTNIPNATNATYSITNLQTNHAGLYSVQVTNFFGEVVSSNGVLNVLDLPPGAEFQITALLTNHSRVVDHNGLTGDDRGGIAASASRVFYTGDSSTARFAMSDLSGGASLGRVFDAIVSDLRTGQIYSLANGATPLSQGGVATTLLEHDGETGLLNGSSIPLSVPISLPSSGVGIFAGYGRVVVHSGARVYDILLPSGVVIDMGPMSAPNHQWSENWAYWGVAEYTGGMISLVYVRNSSTIARTSVPSGATTTVANFSSLSDMAAITVSIPFGRWYFHYEGAGQFGGTDETIGYADAFFNITGATNPPVIYSQPSSRSVVAGRTITFEVGAYGALPLSYQWRKDGVDVPGATNAAHAITNVQPTDAGAYSVLVTNLYGSVLSSNAVLTVLTNAQGRVAVYGAPASELWNIDVRNKIDENGFFTLVDAFPVGPGAPVPTLNDLLQYRAVLVYSDTSFNDGVALGDVLANYVDAGGVVVFATFAFQNIGGRITTGGYLPIALGQQSSGSSLTLIPDVPLHPLLAGVAAFNGGSSSYHHMTALAPGATLVAHWNNGIPLVATKATGPGEVVALNFFPPSSDVRGDFWDASTDGGMLLANALRWGGLSQSNAPVIFVQPGDRAVIAGRPVTFSVTAFGTPPLAYQWRKDGTNLLNATNASYTIVNCQSNDVGSYSVVVTNLYGSVTSSNATLTLVPVSSVVAVFDNPAYVDTTSAGVDPESDNLQASIQTVGFIPVPFTNLITAMQDYQQIAVPEQEIRALGPDLSATTRAAFSNFVFGGGKLIVHGSSVALGRAASLINAVLGSSLVETQSTGPYLRRPAATGTEFEDDPLSLPANNATAALLPASLPAGSRNIYSNATGSPVVMIEKGNGAVIYLGWDWFNAFPRGTQNGGWLTILESALTQSIAARPPVIVVQPQSQGVTSGSNVTLSVVASGTFPFAYQWRFEGSNILSATNISYTVTNATIANQGNYSVAITNEAGSTLSSNAFITVWFRPAILVQPLPQTVLQGQTATFSVVASGTPPLAYRWLRNGITWMANGTSTLVVTNCQSNGVFRVAISNWVGSVNSLSAPLTVLNDYDGDGLPDAWEVQFGLNTNDATDASLDLDGDGMSNRGEYIAHTVPTDPSSVLKILRTATNQAVLKFVAQSNLAYAVQYRTNASSSAWEPMSNVSAQSLLRTVEVIVPHPPVEPGRFYRIATPPP